MRALISLGLSCAAAAQLGIDTLGGAAAQGQSGEPAVLGAIEKRYVSSALFSPDGRTLLTYDTDVKADPVLRAWDIASKRELFSHEESGVAFAFSPDGKTFLTGGKGLRLRETSTGRELASWSTPELQALAFSPDGNTVLAGMRDKTVRLLAAGSGKELAVWGKHPEAVFYVAFTPDGKTAFSASRKIPKNPAGVKSWEPVIKSWDVASGHELASWTLHEAFAVPVIQRDGKAAFLPLSGTLLDLASGRPLWKLETHRETAAFLPDGKTLVAANWNSLSFFDVATGKELGAFPLSAPGRKVAAFSPDGTTALLAQMEIGIKSGLFKDSYQVLRTHLFVDAVPSREEAQAQGRRQAVAQAQIELGPRIQSGDTEEVKRLLELGVDLNASKPGEPTPLFLAVHQGSEDMVKLLLSKGANPNPEPKPHPVSLSGNDLLPLAQAARRGSSPLIKLLIEAGADADKAIDELETHAASVESRGSEHAGFSRRGAERLKRLAERALPASPTAGSAGLSKADFAAIVKEAVLGAAQAPAKAASEPPPPIKRSDVDAPKYKRPENSDDFAVVVGIEKYADLPEAAYAERDALAVRDHMVALGVPSRNVVLLTGQRATKTGLVKNLEAWLPNNVNERSTVFFFYSGHGAPDVKSGQAYLVPIDGDPQYLDETAYPVRRLYERLGALKAKRVIVALDSCFSGAGGRSVLAKGTRPLVTKVDTGFAAGKVVSLSASKADQISGSQDAEGHGLFTYYLLRGLNGAAKDDAGSVTVQSLFEYLAPNVQDQARRENREQVPQLLRGAGDGAAIILR